MAPPRPVSPLSSWLEELLASRALPVGALGALAVAAALYLTGLMLGRLGRGAAGRCWWPWRWRSS